MRLQEGKSPINTHWHARGRQAGLVMKIYSSKKELFLVNSIPNQAKQKRNEKVCFVNIQLVRRRRRLCMTMGGADRNRSDEERLIKRSTLLFPFLQHYGNHLFFAERPRSGELAPPPRGGSSTSDPLRCLHFFRPEKETPTN